MLITIPDVLDQAQLKQCRALLEQAHWEDGKKTAGYLAVDTKSNLQLAIDNPIAKQLGDFLVQVLAQHQTYIAAALPAKLLPPRFNCYRGGGEYGNHIDNALFLIPGSQERIRTDVSSTIFLNEPEEYEGGELVIEDTYGEQRVKLSAGSMVVYPGTSLHRVEPVTQGQRLASFFWAQSMVRHAHQRALLWELDQSIQRLASSGADYAELARLSGVYHNLIREWAEV